MQKLWTFVEAYEHARLLANSEDQIEAVARHLFCTGCDGIACDEIKGHLPLTVS